MLVMWFQGPSLDEMRLMLSYIPLPRNKLRDLLSNRSQFVLDSFLNILYDRKPSILEWDNKDKAEEILRLLELKLLPSSVD